MSRRFEFLPLLIILAAAALLRLLWLDIYPVGWHHDEALMGVMASEVLQGIQRPIFFPGYAGQEPLYIYLAAAVMGLLGNQDIFPVRLTSAGLGIITVAIAYLMAKELYNRRVAIITAALLATNFWQVMSSRNGYRSITQPVLEGLAIYFYWRARRSHAKLWYALTGAALAGATYTYLGGRTFPAVLVAFGLWSLLFERRPDRAAIKRLAILVVATIIVAAPIYLYWLSHPGSYASRMSQVFILNPAVNQGQPLLYISDSLSKALQLFTVRGEMMWRYNLPGRPIFEWTFVPLFYLGVVVILRRAWRRDAASVLIILWMLVMLFPSVLSWDAGGYTLRGMGLVPAVYVFPAVAAVATWDWLGNWLTARKHQNLARVALPAALAVTLVFDAGVTYRDYFMDWSQHFGAAYEDDAHVVAEARYLAAQAHPEREEVFAGSDYRGHPIVAQLAPAVYKQLRWFDGSQSIVYSPDLNRDSHYVLSFTTIPQNVERYFPPEALIGSAHFDRGIYPDQPLPIKYLAYRLSPSQIQHQVQSWLDDSRTKKLEGSFGGQVRLLGAQVPSRVTVGETLPVTIIWQVLSLPQSDDYVFFTHLLDERAVMWSQNDRNGYPTLEWRQGDVVVGRYDLKVPADLAPGKYAVDFGLYDRNTNARLTLDSNRQMTTAIVADLKVQPAVPPAPTLIKHHLDKQMGSNFKLLGYDFASPSDRRDALDVTLLWSALAKSNFDYTVFLQVLNAEGKLVAQSDSMPAANRFPTSIWDPGDTVIDTHRLTLDPSLPRGDYRLIAGMYLLATGERLPVQNGGDFVELGHVSLPVP